MSFFSILIALMLEQVHPIGPHHPIRVWVTDFIVYVRTSCDAGRHSQAVLIWSLTLLVPCLVVVLVQWALHTFLGWPAVVVWNIVILHFTLGFRQFSFHLTGIRKALDNADEGLARQLLTAWRYLEARKLAHAPAPVHHQVMETSVLAAHQSVFGVFFWYAVLASLGLGPAGAVMYRFSELTYRLCGRVDNQSPHTSAPVRDFSTKIWGVMDWLPVRMTAISFAMVGNFEEVIDKWRGVRDQHITDPVAMNETLLLSTALAAINISPAGPQPAAVVQGGEQTEFGATEQFTDSRIQSDGDVSGSQLTSNVATAALNQLVGLVWRSVLLWMLLLALLSAANLLG